MLVAKRLQICVVLGCILGLQASASSASLSPKQSITLRPEFVRKSEERWQEPFPAAEDLDGVDQMQFFKGRQTSHNRSKPIPQLQCTDGCDSYEPSMVQCTNAKSPDQGAAQWRCEADLPRHLKFHKTTINCEGFESSEDTRILPGSCGLVYSLTNNGLNPVPGRVHRRYYTVNNEDRDGDQMRGWTASWAVVIGVLLYLIKYNWSSPGL